MINVSGPVDIKKLRDLKIKRSLSDEWLFILFWGLGVLAVVVGGYVIIDAWTPAQAWIWTLDKTLATGFLLLCSSFLLHGFHPILLVSK